MGDYSWMKRFKVEAPGGSGVHRGDGTHVRDARGRPDYA